MSVNKMISFYTEQVTDIFRLLDECIKPTMSVKISIDTSRIESTVEIVGDEETLKLIVVNMQGNKNWYEIYQNAQWVDFVDTSKLLSEMNLK